MGSHAGPTSALNSVRVGSHAAGDLAHEEGIGLRRLLLSAIAASALAGPAWGQSDSYVNGGACSNGAIRSCASISITTALSSTFGNVGGTVVEVYLRNLQGTDPNDNTGGSFLTKFGLLNSGLGAFFGPLTVSLVGSVGTGGTPLDDWGTAGSYNEIGNPSIAFSTQGSPSKNGAIQGCTLTSSPTDYFKTCDGAGDTGSVLFRFETTGRWYASNAQFGYKVQRGGGADSVECVSNVDPSNPKFCDPPVSVETTVAPEPVTMALVATGVLGLVAAGGFSRRRITRD
jgi:hypothetical protein